MIIHNSANLKQQRVRLIVTIAAIFGFKIWSQDIFQTCLQSEIHLTCDDYVRPKGGIVLKAGWILKIFKLFNRLADSGECWHQSKTNHLKKNFKIQSLTGDLACFVNLAIDS